MNDIRVHQFGVIVAVQTAVQTDQVIAILTKCMQIVGDGDHGLACVIQLFQQFKEAAYAVAIDAGFRLVQNEVFAVSKYRPG